MGPVTGTKGGAACTSQQRELKGVIWVCLTSPMFMEDESRRRLTNGAVVNLTTLGIVDNLKECNIQGS